jgi:hypothetical protein
MELAPCPAEGDWSILSPLGQPGAPHAHSEQIHEPVDAAIG